MNSKEFLDELPAYHQLEHWFDQRGWHPFAFQRQAWSAYLAGKSGLIHAETGTGKTYAAWLGPVLEWMSQYAQAEESIRPKGNKRAQRQRSANLRVLWITPLRALAKDIATNLQEPLDAWQLPWSLEIRTGDTSASARARQKKKLPTALITTPESLSLLLTWNDAEERFAELQTVVVDEWHELLGNKRGVQTELALARLRRWNPNLRIWGLSATIGNLTEAKQVLLGENRSSESKQATESVIISGSEPKAIQVDCLLPATMERFPWAGHLGIKLLPQVIAELDQANTALVFTNTRSQTELWYQHLLAARPDWAGKMALHHGSLDRDVRSWVEEQLRTGGLRCVVCTSSLDLGVDFSPVERVFQIGSPKGVARLLQRAGRSGHQPGVASRVTCVPTHAFELVEVAAVREAVARRWIESRPPLEKPLDLLAQHAVTIALGSGFTKRELLDEVRSTYAYRNLTDQEWDWVLAFIVHGGNSLQAYPDYHRVAFEEDKYTVQNRRIARQHRMSIGTITSDAAMKVKYLKGPTLGTIEEAFIARLKPQEKFVFAGRTLTLVRVKDMTAWVRKARDSEAAVPRWMGGRMPLSTELSLAVREKLTEVQQGQLDSVELQSAQEIFELQARWSVIPNQEELLIERVKTREGHHLYLYPFAGRFVHEGLAAIFAYRLARLQPITFTWSVNDYGMELLSTDRAPLTEALERGLFNPQQLREDIQASLNETEMAKRQFREIARVAGLVFHGFPGQTKNARQLQASSGLFYDVFREYDPSNLLLHQAHREVLDHQLEYSRLHATLVRLQNSRILLQEPKRPTPFAFPLLVDRLRERLSSEKLADRIQKMTVAFEKAARG